MAASKSMCSDVLPRKGSLPLDHTQVWNHTTLISLGVCAPALHHCQHYVFVALQLAKTRNKGRSFKHSERRHNTPNASPEPDQIAMSQPFNPIEPSRGAPPRRTSGLQINFYSMLKPGSRRPAVAQDVKVPAGLLDLLVRALQFLERAT